MAKALIATFSQSGSTKKVADQITKGLGSSNFEVTLINITKDQTPDLKDYDIIGIGSPTYFFRPPFIVEDYVNNLKGIENKFFFVFVLHGTVRGNCSNWIRKELNRKGAKEIGLFTSYGADYWIGYIKRGVLFSSNSPSLNELSSAQEFGKTLANRFKNQNYVPVSFDPSTPFVYALERSLVSRPLAKLIYSKSFKVDKNCDNCGLCIKKCPVHNIINNGKLKWQSNCLLCGTCELACPQDAIHAAFDWFVFAPFMIYNINRSKNKMIPFVNVIHKNGKTIKN